MGKIDAAIVSFNQAVKLGDNWALLDLAETHQRLGNSSEAANYAKAFIEIASKDRDFSDGVEDAKAILNALR